VTTGGEGSDRGRVPLSRRGLLRTGACLGVVSVTGNTVFDGSLYAVSAATGDRQWVADTGGAVDSSPTVDSGTLYVGTNSGVTVLATGAEGSRARFGTLGHPSDWRYAGQELDDGEGDTGGADGAGGDTTAGDDTAGNGAGDDGTTDDGSDSSGNDCFGPGFGAGAALAVLGGLALLARRHSNGDSEQ